tara:strand:+ start:3255 stop:3374 length:120 start_codon:yes stop_codon:yes gene_type:complete
MDTLWFGLVLREVMLREVMLREVTLREVTPRGAVRPQLP